MVLVELAAVPDAALPVETLRDHLRLSTGFSDGGAENNHLLLCLRSALSTIEARTGKALLVRPYRWSVTAWRDLARQSLPIAPVVALTALRIVDQDEVQTLADPDSYRLVADGHRPQLVSTKFILPTIPVGGSAEIDFEAGYAADWDTVPANIAQAVIHLAAFLYDHRFDASGVASSLPETVTRLIEPFREVRLGRGSGR